MLRIIALLSIVARCAAFGTFSAPGEVCIDEPAHLVAERTAAMGENYTAFTSCDVIAEAGGCDHPDAKVVLRDVRAPSQEHVPLLRGSQERVAGQIRSEYTFYCFIRASPSAATRSTATTTGSAKVAPSNSALTVGRPAAVSSRVAARVRW